MYNTASKIHGYATLCFDPQHNEFLREKSDVNSSTICFSDNTFTLSKGKYKIIVMFASDMSDPVTFSFSSNTYRFAPNSSGIHAYQIFLSPQHANTYTFGIDDLNFKAHGLIVPSAHVYISISSIPCLMNNGLVYGSGNNYMLFYMEEKKIEKDVITKLSLIDVGRNFKLTKKHDLRVEVLCNFDTTEEASVECSYHNHKFHGNGKVVSGDSWINFFCNLSISHLDEYLFFQTSSDCTMKRGFVLISDNIYNESYRYGYVNLDYVTDINVVEKMADRMILSGFVDVDTNSYSTHMENLNPFWKTFRQNSIYLVGNTFYKFIFQCTIPPTSIHITFVLRSIHTNSVSKFTYVVNENSFNKFLLLFYADTSDYYTLTILKDVPDHITASIYPYTENTTANTIQTYISHIPTLTNYNMAYGVSDTHCLCYLEQKFANDEQEIVCKKIIEKGTFNIGDIVRVEIIIEFDSEEDTEVKLYFGNHEIRSSSNVLSLPNFCVNFVDTVTFNSLSLYIKCEKFCILRRGFMLIQKDCWPRRLPTGYYTCHLNTNFGKTDNGRKIYGSFLVTNTTNTCSISLKQPDPFAKPNSENELSLDAGYYKVVVEAEFENDDNNIFTLNFNFNSYSFTCAKKVRSAFILYLPNPTVTPVYLETHICDPPKVSLSISTLPSLVMYKDDGVPWYYSFFKICRGSSYVHYELEKIYSNLEQRTGYTAEILLVVQLQDIMTIDKIFEVTVSYGGAYLDKTTVCIEEHREVKMVLSFIGEINKIEKTFNLLYNSYDLKIDVIEGYVLVY